MKRVYVDKSRSRLIFRFKIRWKYADSYVEIQISRPADKRFFPFHSDVSQYEVNERNRTKNTRRRYVTSRFLFLAREPHSNY